MSVNQAPSETDTGFTLIEILIVIAIIGILALIIFVALNPVGRFADARNTNRLQNIEAIGKAILQYNTDNAGLWPSMLPQLQNGANDTNGFNTTTGEPDCTYGSVIAGDNSVAANVTAGCMWADGGGSASNPSSIMPILTPKYLTNIPLDSGVYSHYFVALTPDQSHVVVISDSMDTAGVTTNPGGSSIYYREF